MHSSDKKIHMKPIVKITIFIILIVVISQVLDFILVPWSYARVALHQLNSKESNYDCIIVGASHGRSGIDPYIIDEQTGYNSFNLCIPSERIMDTYYLVKQSTQNNDVKTVIFDIDYQYWLNAQNNPISDAFIYYQLPFSLVKMQFFADNIANEDFRVSLFRWTNCINHVPRIDIAKNLQQKLNADYFNYKVIAEYDSDSGGPYVGKGFYSRFRKRNTKGTYKKIQFSGNQISSDALKYFEKLKDYCSQNGIRLVCVTSPITPITMTSGNYNDIHDYFADYFKKNNVEYYDFNYAKGDLLNFDNRQFIDYEGHISGELADEYSAALGKVVKDSSNQGYDSNSMFYNSYDDVCANIYEHDGEDISVYVTDAESGEKSVSIKAENTDDAIKDVRYRISVINFNNDIFYYETEYSDNCEYDFMLDKGVYDIKLYKQYGENEDTEQKIYTITVNFEENADGYITK